MMDGIIRSFEAGEDLQEAMLVKLSDGKVVKATAVTDAVIGVTHSAVKAGRVADVILEGVAYVQVDSATNAGDILVAKEGGKAQAFSLDLFADLATDTAIHTVGKVLEADATGAYLKTVITNAVMVVPSQKTTETKTEQTETEQTEEQQGNE